ncbi:MAG: N-6 DNA methylase [Actinomycetota bacterium]|nr:N-6 DNA methylase [Actinomycetota bacterium]
MPEEVIPPGKIKCFITGKLRKDTSEERIRQDVVRSLVEEYGYNKSDIDVEFPIKMGRAKKRADIVIFSEDGEHTQENIYIIAEVKTEDVKPSDRKEGVGQLGSYVAASPNSAFALWVGNERLAFTVVEERGKRVLTRIPDVPKRRETTIPKPTSGRLVPAVNLKQVFKRVHNYIYVNQGFQKDKAFEELQKLIFIKVYDEQYDPTLQFYILPGEDISKVRNRLTKVFQKVQERYKYIFKGNETLELNDSVLSYIVSELQRFSFVDTETDVKGEAYEEVVGPNLRGDRGEFFTARNVCSMAIEMLFSLFPEEKLTSPGALKILDPAVGTGGFLIAGVQKIKQMFLKRGFRYDQLRDLVRDVVNTNFYGIEFNPFLVKVSQMNMVMHGDGSSNIVHANSLEKLSNWNDEAKRKVHLEEFDIVVTNPPFGTKAVIDNPDILSQFELTTFKVGSPRTALPPEQLFIERCLDFLKPGGILGIVLPDSILSNPGLIWIREWILKKTYIIASVDLPVETFEPHTGTQTSILILKKKTSEQEKLKEDYDIFMAIPEKVGHDRRGNPVFKTTPEGEIELAANGQPAIDDHIPLVAEMFKEWIRRKGMV